MVVSYRSFVSSLSRVLNLHLSRSDLQAASLCRNYLSTLVLSLRTLSILCWKVGAYKILRLVMQDFIFIPIQDLQKNMQTPVGVWCGYQEQSSRSHSIINYNRLTISASNLGMGLDAGSGKNSLFNNNKCKSRSQSRNIHLT